MPVRKLEEKAKKRGLKPGSKRFNAYVYGTEQKIERRRKAKRKASARKRVRKTGTRPGYERKSIARGSAWHWVKKKR